MGVYMGVFNFFIVVPEIIASVAFGPLIRVAFGVDNPNAPLYVVMIGGVCLIAAAVAMAFVRDVGESVGVRASAVGELPTAAVPETIRA
jgi:maltose/moltooligosaccharide transporter